MNKLEQAARQALEALEVSTDWDVGAKGKQLQSMKAITALREALVGVNMSPTEQAEQEPVAWVSAKESFCGFPKLVFSETQKDGYKPLYAAPVRTKDLTDDDLREIMKQPFNQREYLEQFARAVIAAYKEKNK